MKRSNSRGFWNITQSLISLVFRCDRPPRATDVRLMCNNGDCDRRRGIGLLHRYSDMKVVIFSGNPTVLLIKVKSSFVAGSPDFQLTLHALHGTPHHSMHSSALQEGVTWSHGLWRQVPLPGVLWSTWSVVECRRVPWSAWR